MSKGYTIKQKTFCNNLGVISVKTICACVYVGFRLSIVITLNVRVRMQIVLRYI